MSLISSFVISLSCGQSRLCRISNFANQIITTTATSVCVTTWTGLGLTSSFSRFQRGTVDISPGTYYRGQLFRYHSPNIHPTHR